MCSSTEMGKREFLGSARGADCDCDKEKPRDRIQGCHPGGPPFLDITLAGPQKATCEFSWYLRVLSFFELW